MSQDLDAVIAAPKFHKLLFENERVRVLDTCVEPGETVPVHTHRWPASYYILSFDHFIRRDGDGKILVDTRDAGVHMEPGSSAWGEPLGPHSLENVGQRPIRIIVTELKS